MPSPDMPTDLPPSGAEPIEPGGSPRPRRNRLLIGCLTAAGLLIVLILVGIVSFVTWIRKPGPSLDPALLVDRDTVLYAELRLRPEDEAVRELLLDFTRRMQSQVERAGEETQNPVPWLFGGSQEGPTASDLEKALPVVAVVTRQESDAGLVSRALMAANVPKMGNRIRFVAWFFTLFMGWADEGGGVSEHRGYRIVTLREGGDPAGRGASESPAGSGVSGSPEQDGSPAVEGSAAAGFEPLELSVVGATLLVSREAERIRWAIDRIVEAGEEAGAGGLTHEILASRPESALLFISARGGFADQVIRIIRRGAPEFASALGPMMEGAGPVTIRADLVSPDALEGEIHVAAGSPDEKEQDEYAGSVTAVLPAGELTMSLESIPRMAGERHAWRIRVTGLAGVAFGSLELLDIDESRPGSVPDVSVEPEKDANGPAD